MQNAERGTGRVFAAEWPGGLYGAPRGAAVTLCEVDGGWGATLDVPWKGDGVDLGAFPTIERWVDFLHGPARRGEGC